MRNNRKYTDRMFFVKTADGAQSYLSRIKNENGSLILVGNACLVVSLRPIKNFCLVWIPGLTRKLLWVIVAADFPAGTLEGP